VIGIVSPFWDAVVEAGAAVSDGSVLVNVDTADEVTSVTMDAGVATAGNVIVVTWLLTVNV